MSDFHTTAMKLPFPPLLSQYPWSLFVQPAPRRSPTLTESFKLVWQSVLDMASSSMKSFASEHVTSQPGGNPPARGTNTKETP